MDMIEIAVAVVMRQVLAATFMIVPSVILIVTGVVVVLVTGVIVVVTGMTVRDDRAAFADENGAAGIRAPTGRTHGLVSFRSDSLDQGSPPGTRSPLGGNRKRGRA
jgi:hypothetical protein